METWSFYSAGIRIAREAVDASGREAYVAADIGPLTTGGAFWARAVQ